MVRRPTGCRWLNALEARLGQIERIDKHTTRTGLLSSMKSSRHSGNSVHCPRSASSTKRLVNSPTESRENHNSGTAFSHSLGQFRTSARFQMKSALPQEPDITQREGEVRK